MIVSRKTGTGPELRLTRTLKFALPASGGPFFVKAEATQQGHAGRGTYALTLKPLYRGGRALKRAEGRPGRPRHPGHGHDHEPRADLPVPRQPEHRLPHTLHLEVRPGLEAPRLRPPGFRARHSAARRRPVSVV